MKGEVSHDTLKIQSYFLKMDHLVIELGSGLEFQYWQNIDTEVYFSGRF